MYIPGSDNVVADALSRWAYPASKAFADVSLHGSKEDDRLMQELIAQERREEKTCRVVHVAEILDDLRAAARRQLEGLLGDRVEETAGVRAMIARLSAVIDVTTRGGANTGSDSAPPETVGNQSSESDDEASRQAQVERAEGPVADSAGPAAAPAGGEVAEPGPPEEDGNQPAQGEPDSEAEYDTASGSDDEEGEVDEAGNLIRPAGREPRQEPSRSPAVIEEAIPRSSGSPLEGVADDIEGSNALDNEFGAVVVEGGGNCPSDHVPEELRGAALTRIMEQDWTPYYRDCPTWGPAWKQVRGEVMPTEWPKGVQCHEGRLYREGLLCIPTAITGGVIRAHHQEAGHLGGPRLWKEMGRRYAFAKPSTARQIADRVQGQCETCQATEPSHVPYKFPIELHPVPPHLMDSVSIDLFAMPEVSWRGSKYDTIALCVDRESGWIVATPHLDKGLTGRKIAEDMFQQWGMFGIPSRVSSDRGAHFASNWWKTLCAAHGVRVGYGQAYHHRAQGKVERTGQEVIRKLSKLNVDEGTPWPELLPRVLRHLHDAPGPTGLSPYEIVFGRYRGMAGIPYQPEREAEDASKFLERIRELDTQVARTFDQKHLQRMAQVNRDRREPPAFEKGTKVWYRPERRPGTDKLEVVWKGPAVVIDRTGNYSYIIQISEGRTQEAHRTQLRRHVADEFVGEPMPLYSTAQKAEVLEAEPDTWTVERIEDERVGRNGQREFLTRWQGFGPDGDTWEPLSSFFPQVNEELVKFCAEKGTTTIELNELYKPTNGGPMEV